VVKKEVKKGVKGGGKEGVDLGEFFGFLGCFLRVFLILFKNGQRCKDVQALEISQIALKPFAQIYLQTLSPRATFNS
jgi:hypothetical protein